MSSDPPQGVAPNQIDTYADYTRAVADFIARNPHVLGGADIHLSDFEDEGQRTGALIAILLGIRESDQRPAVRMYRVLAPPGANPASLQSAIWEAIAAAVEVLSGAPPPGFVADWLRPRIRVDVLPDRRAASVMKFVISATDREAVVVLEAASYRDDEVAPYISAGAETPLRPEDVWAPQLHALAQAAVDQVRGQAVHVAFDAGQPTPRRPELQALLQSIEGCGVVGMGADDTADVILGQRVDQWDQWIREGRLGRALQDADALPAKFESQKAFLKAQLLHRAGQGPRALQMIRQDVDLDRDIDASSRVKLARIARTAGASGLAAELLGPTVAALNSQEDLESALATAQECDAIELADHLAQRLQSLFPKSPGLKDRRSRALWDARDYATLAAESETPEQANIYRLLDQHLGQRTPDYSAMIAAAGPDVQQAEVLRMAAVEDALRRRQLVAAFELARPPAQIPAFEVRRARRLLDVLEALFLLMSRDERFPVPAEDVRAALVSLIENLAADPGRTQVRLGLTRLIQPSIAGATGLALMAAATLDLASKPITLTPRAMSERTSMAWLADHKPFLAQLFQWLNAEQPVVIGRLAVPADIMTEPADDVVGAVAGYVEYAPISDAADVRDLQTWVALGAAVAPHCSDPNFDLRLIRIAAGKLASVGFAQAARDLTEQALLNGTTTPARRRLAWFTMADVYLRVGNQLEGLLALSCTFASSEAADPEEAFQETMALARALRDIGLTDQGMAAAAKAREILLAMDLVEAEGHRVDTLELQIRLRDPAIEDLEGDVFQQLLHDTVGVARTVLSRHEQTEPIASLLGPLVRRAKLAGAPMTDGAEATLAELIEHARGGLQSRLRAMAEKSPAPEDFLQMVRSAGAARYSDDVGFDTSAAALLANRALADDDYCSSPERAAFALEVLADRGVAMPGWDEFAEPPPPPETLDGPLNLARALSNDGFSVIQAGCDDQGQLVRLETVAGAPGAVIREPRDLFEMDRFRAWSTTFPFTYGIDETTPNLFLTTTEGLRFSSIPGGPVVLVSDARLQGFPPNLLRLGDSFAGREQPMAAAPSVAWLAAARAKGQIGDGRRCAWISAADSNGQTLAMISQRLEATFGAHGFSVDISPSLPETFAGASLAVITAHGGVHPEGRYFQVVTDDGELRVSAVDLANALRNVDVVILFVCSGGRSDRHPTANTTLGLAKQILDRGCTAVVASPWPLDARVPSHWLPEFLTQWDAGAPLIAANFAANAVVDRNFGLDPARGLAMTVFGDPAARRETARAV